MGTKWRSLARVGSVLFAGVTLSCGTGLPPAEVSGIAEGQESKGSLHFELTDPYGPTSGALSGAAGGVLIYAVGGTGATALSETLYLTNE
ncbi:MAG: hypothetical protein AAB425_07985 [Bdellovibrionota bacterium]